MEPHLALRSLVPADLLLRPCAFDGLSGEIIGQITGDSREVECCGGESVSLFFAVRGTNFDGHAFIGDVFGKNPSAIVVSESDISADFPRSIRVGDIQKAMAVVAKRFFGSPDERMRVIAITGTDGKTTTAHLCRAMVSTCTKTGMFGTVEYDTGGTRMVATNTTPGAIPLFSMMREALRNGCRAVALEISSHAIEQKRAHGLNVDAAVFTNLSPEHLDFHGTLGNYFLCKRKLFDGGNGRLPKISAINIDDGCGRELIDFLRKSGQPVISYGFSRDADFRICAVEKNDMSGAEFTVVSGGKSHRFHSRIFGEHNLMNITSAFAACMSICDAADGFIGAVSEFAGVPGRLERLNLPNGAIAFVDYAHTPRALALTIETLRPLKNGRMITVFGCTGMRDTSKRAPMTKIANEMSDFAIATSDDPHEEPQEDIFRDMKNGVTDESRIVFTEDRRAAIATAVEMSRAGDIILVAGKGHELCQQINGGSVDFSDRAVLGELCLSA
ncbi:MAG: UDP-N-acetylmuramoyl-L-alanyl-D-glutamate--2,6-diaminopimelate ligase [Puniceicoccales bacterium]|nr:UDP-N-acetylmuramoyl-L-alanyl-D-glutamate--2,6-diaminopimelate ligase [Puniceicoccales bacterium]